MRSARFFFGKRAMVVAAAMQLAGLVLAQTTTTPALIVKPATLFFRQTASTPPATQTLTVSVKTGTPGSLTVTPSAGWLQAAANGATVTVGVNTNGLATGKYTGSLGISADGFTSASVAVSLTVVGNNVAVFPSTLNLSAIVGGEEDPRGREVNVYNQNGSAFSWTAATDQGWLTVSPASGTGKAGLSVTVNPANLTAAGNFTGHVTVTDTTNSTMATVTVNLTATAAQPPNFELGPSLNTPAVLHFIADTNAATPAPKIFYAQNLGGSGSLSFTLTSTVNSPSGGNWLSFSPSSNTTPALTTVKVNPAGLAPGTYTATISGTAPAGSTWGFLSGSLTVYLTVLGNPGIRVDKKLVRFTSSTRQNPPSPSPAGQTITFSTQSTRGYPFTANVTTASGGNWLSVIPSSGTATSGSTVSISVNSTVVANLAPGFYTGEVQFNFSGGSPQAQITVGVGLRVWGPNDPPTMNVNPGGLEFTEAVGGSGSQNVNVRAESAAAGGLNFTVATAVSSPVGGSWLTSSVSSGTATSTATSVPINVNAAGLATGTYTGTVTFTPDPTTNAPVQIVNVNLVVSAGTLGSVLGTSPPIAAGPLLATLISSPDNFIWYTDSALPVAAYLTDSAGNPVSNATMTLTSSNGEPDVTLEAQGGGEFTGIFVPQTAGTVTLSVSAQATDNTGTLFRAGNNALVTGDIVPSTDVATPVFTNGAVSNASYAPQPTPITPGGLLSVFGYNIAGTGGTASSLPLPISIGGANVTIGGYSAFLLGTYPATAPGGLDQINLQVPWELDGQAVADMVITSGGVISAPQRVSVALAPAIFTISANGTGDAVVQDNTTGVAITRNNPATAGEVIRIYCSGLGDLQTGIGDGVGASGADSTMSTVNVTIGGQPAVAAYAGAAPGYAGLYQINVTVPPGLTTGENNLIVYVNGNPATGQATITVH